jgi:hypothetical protein
MDLVIFFGFTAIVIFAFAAVFWGHPRRETINWVNAVIIVAQTSVRLGQACVDVVRSRDDIPSDFEAACVDIEAACREVDAIRIECEIGLEAAKRKNISNKFVALAQKLRRVTDQLEATIKDFCRLVGIEDTSESEEPKVDVIAEASLNELVEKTIRYYDASIDSARSAIELARLCVELGRTCIEEVRTRDDVPPEFEAACVDVEAACREVDAVRIELAIDIEASEKQRHSVSFLKGNLDLSSLEVSNLSFDYKSTAAFFKEEADRIGALVEQVEFVANRLHATTDDFRRLVGLDPSASEKSDDIPALPGPEAGIKARAA